jgi:hypothetical protein
MQQQGLSTQKTSLKQKGSFSMDKMTNGKIKAWLKKNNSRLLEEYNTYLTRTMADISAQSGHEKNEVSSLSLRGWLEHHYPEVLDKIPLW